MEVNTDLARLEEILQQTIAAIKESQGQISSIADEARAEAARLKRELEKVRSETLAVIEQADAARAEEQRSRLELMRVSRDFSRYSEEDIRRAYERARDAQVRLILLMEKEKNLRARRDEIERNLRSVTRLLERSEALAAQVGVALEYLSGNIEQLSQTIETVQEKREIAVRVIRAQEEERRRVARDLHDGLAQQLASALLEIQVMGRLLAEKNTEKARAELENVEKILRAGLRETRNVIFNLRPLSLDNLGLKAAVEKLVAQVREKTGLEVAVTVHGEERRLNDTVLSCVFRIIQEALNNVVKHAEATEAKVRIEFNPSFLAVRVVDNGKGFTPGEKGVPKAGEGEHLGLLGMRERAELIGGSLTVKSSPGQGTRVEFHLPLGSPPAKGDGGHQ
ncbi:MAG: two-component system, NarL family, sensor histidine kinase DegS [Bacillota bacterium]|nr:two-component system, NarL family, sensor histidine kinase DegS [Bacillota bacterium]MDK2856007.1 two-component system, NarL family, sensor histidine kinase DegS [Bacillota bacterium]MDK2925895.1 two-component system, NarL family, sensor histidine kinase DegS [Bacillota bacterium]